MKVSRMKLCSAFVINYPFLLCFQQYKGLRFSKLTLSQMGNKTEQHTQNCLWYYFFHLISIPCIHAAGRPSALLRIPPPCCFFVGFFSPQKKDLFSSFRCMITARSGSPTASSLSFLRWSSPFFPAHFDQYSVYFLQVQKHISSDFLCLLFFLYAKLVCQASSYWTFIFSLEEKFWRWVSGHTYKHSPWLLFLLLAVSPLALY